MSPPLSTFVPAAMLGRMAIQFQCASCGEPIEIDAEWAGKPVACPYCRRTVLAPTESTFAPPGVPAARPAVRGAAFEALDPAESAAGPFDVRREASNSAAVWAIVLTCSALSCGLTAVVVLAPHLDELRPFIEMSESGKSFSEVNRAFVEQLEGAMPLWLLVSSLLALAAMGLWVVGLICGIVAVRRAPRRGLAIASLVLSALMALAFIPRGN